LNTQLIVALDVPSAKEIPDILRRLPNQINTYKVGLELFAGEGLDSLSYLRTQAKKIFLDLKLHDIPRTVARAVSSAGRHAVDLLTIHAGGGSEMLRAAADAAAQLGDKRPRLLAVTTLTSLGAQDLIELGISRSLQDHTLALAELALNAGIDGLVCSPLELEAMRKRFGAHPILVAPGVRPTGADAGDQKRIATPAAAARAGATYIVVGRPILEAPDPRAAADRILRELDDLPLPATGRAEPCRDRRN
jgi:orotidine-5'-phosphate decarboxylase